MQKLAAVMAFCNAQVYDVILNKSFSPYVNLNSHLVLPTICHGDSMC